MELRQRGGGTGRRRRLDYMDGYRVFTVDAEPFPDLAGLVRELGVRVVTIIDPGVKAEPGYAVYDELVRRGFACLGADGRPWLDRVWPGKCVFPDFTNRGCRHWWGDLHHGLVEARVDGIWVDMNEPSAFLRGDVAGRRPARRRRSLGAAQRVQAPDGAGDLRGARAAPTRPAAVRPHPGGLGGDAALRRHLDGRQPLDLRPRCGKCCFTQVFSRRRSGRNLVMQLGDQQSFQFLIHDRGTKFSHAFDEIFSTATESAPPGRPSAHSQCSRTATMTAMRGSCAMLSAARRTASVAGSTSSRDVARSSRSSSTTSSREA